MRRVRGRGAAPGLAVGRAVVAVGDALHVRYRLATSGVERERQRLRSARDRTRSELEDISSRIARTLGSAQAAIFAAQILMLDDPLLFRRADELIREERINGDWAIERAVAEIHEALAREGDTWTRDGFGDLNDVGTRLQRNLRPQRDLLADLVREIEPPLVIVADELPPSVAAQIDWSRVRGLISDVGSPTHHTVILARSLGVPAVVGLGRATQIVAPGISLAIDGVTGEVVLEPDDETLARWQQRAQLAEAGERALAELRDRPATTADGCRITLEANLEIADDVGRVRRSGAEGIGLYRSEFLLDRDDPEATTEDAQYEIYRGLLDAMAPRPVTIRTFDTIDPHRESRPRSAAHRERFGMRGIRTQDGRLRQQIRALLRAAPAGHLRILLPFVSSTEEFRDARRLVDDERRALGVSVQVPVGAMIEVPAAALVADHLAAVADFLSVGTNDLIQYTLAVDRTDERLAGVSPPWSPAVVRLLRLVSRAARRAGRDLSVCGEMAADPRLVALLVGLGFSRFSMTPGAIASVKRSLSTLDSRRARKAARQALGAPTADAVEALLDGALAAATKADEPHQKGMSSSLGVSTGPVSAPDGSTDSA